MAKEEGETTMTENDSFKITWRCSECGRRNSIKFTDMEWNVTRDPCNDIDGVYFHSCTCMTCGFVTTSTTNTG